MAKKPTRLIDGTRYTPPKAKPKKPTPPKPTTTKPKTLPSQPKTKIPYPPKRLYIPAGTNDVWVGSTPEYPGMELETYAPLVQNQHPNLFLTQPQETSGGGGGGGEGGGEPAATPITWSSQYELPGAPSWWKGMMPSQWTPETEFAAMVNALIPYMSGEDQRQMGVQLAQLFPDGFGTYSPEQTSYPTPPTSISQETSTYYQSQKRASDILSALDKMKAVSGKDEKALGPGYLYLRTLAQTMKDFGAGTDAKNMSRRQIVDMYGALDPLLAQATSEQLGAYEGVAKALTQPFFSAAKLLDVYKDESGNWVFGKANKSWF